MKTQILTIIMLTAAFGLNAQGPWIQKAALDNIKCGHSSVAMDGKIYLVGGSHNWDQPPLTTLEVYDPLLDSWSSGAHMDTGRTFVSTCVVNGKIWAIGGGRSYYRNPTQSITEYNPASDSWTYVEKMPRPRTHQSAVLLNGKIYIFGGGGTNIDPIAEVDVYDTLTKQWTTVADLPTPRMNMSAVVLDGKIYAIGGMLGLSDNEKTMATVEMYDPVADTWTTKAKMNSPRKYISGCAYASSGKIYVFGGTPGFLVPSLSSVEEYDPITDTWTIIMEMPLEICAHSVAWNGGKAYISGGITGVNPITYTNKVYEYDPHNDLSTLFEKTELDKGYVTPVIDSVLITTKMKDTSGITLMAEINAPDQIPVDSILLFDDGAHNDGLAGDGLYANVLQVSSSEEQQYYIDLLITRIETDTTIQQLNNVAAFTSIGPVILDKYIISGDDTVFNPGDFLGVKLVLKNNSNTTTANNIKAQLLCEDTLVSTSSLSRSCGSLTPGGNAETSGFYSIKILNEHQANTEVPIIVLISSNDYVFWTDTFSIRIEPTTSLRSIGNSIARIYPNPVHDKLTIEFNENVSPKTSITLYNITGKIIYSENLVDVIPLRYTINLSAFKKGLYLIHISNDQYSYTEKVIKVE